MGRQTYVWMREGAGETYPDASLGCLGVAVSHAGDSVEFLVEEDDVGDFSQLGALFADVLFDVEYRRRVVLKSRVSEEPKW